MESYRKDVQVRWSDLDPNFHLRHSVYYDWGAFTRVEFLYEHQLPIEVLTQLNIGIILLREECVFKKEIRLGDKVYMTLELLKARQNFSRWSIQHIIYKNDDIVSAILSVDGAFIDSVKRKLATPPEQVYTVFNSMPRHKEFTWLD